MKENKKVTLERQINDVESRLEHLYDALETGSFSNDELAPRIQKWKTRQEELSRARDEAELALQLNIFEIPDIRIVREYVDDLKSRRIKCGLDIRGIQKTEEQDEFAKVVFGRPYRSRTCDTLIKRYRRIVLPNE